MTHVQNQAPKNNWLKILTHITAWSAAAFFILMTSTLIQNFNVIINQQKSNEHTDLKKYIQSIESVLTNISVLPDQIGTRSASQLISEYNKTSDEFNQIVLSASQIQSLKNNTVLKNKLIEANNNSLEYINIIKKQVSAFRKSGPQPIQDYLKNYSEILVSAESDTANVFKTSSPSQYFLISLFGFTFFIFSVVTLTLISNRKQKNILFQTESQLNTFLNVINNMSEAVVVTDPQGFFTYYNQSALDIIGPHVKDVHYNSSIEILGFQTLTGEKITKTDLPFHAALKKETTVDQEIRIQNEQHPDGIYISASSGFYVNQSGQTAGSVVVMKNITHKKQMEELWIKQKESAIEGSKKKSDFLASMSHEIRTPMNGIIGITTLLNETPLNPEQKDYVGTVQRSAHSLLSLINDILDHSKIEAGKVDLVSDNFNLKILIKDVFENFKHVSSEKNIQLICNYPSELPIYFVSDANRLRQILMNLIGNAVKFTSIGHVQLKMDFLKTNGQTRVKFNICDTGAGMDADEVDRLFQRFFQTKSGIKFGGTGLGLSISKQLVDLMGGTIGVQSQINLGTTFWFELNLADGTVPIITENILTLTHLENSFDGHILIAEDNLVNQKVVSQYLKKLGFTVDIANNGAEAVEKFKTQHYDLIFMDCQMPIMTGYEATGQILKLQSSQPHCVPIVALTAEGTSGEKLKCFAAGMNDFLNKPLVFEHLALLLKKYFIPRAQMEHKIAAPQSNSKNDLSEIYKLSQFKVDGQLLLHVLLNDYMATTPELIDKMKQSSTHKNIDAVCTAAHTLKSASATLSAVSVSLICQGIENCAATSDFVQIDLLLMQIDIEYTQSIVDIQKVIFEIENSQKASA